MNIENWLKENRKKTLYSEVKKYATDEVHAKGYRESDPQALEDPVWHTYADIIKKLCNKFDRKINALDVGCGTGRFFCALENVKELHGIDLSGPMLEHARNPVKGDIVKKNVEQIILHHAPIYDIEKLFEPKKFDFVFSIGTMNEYGDTSKATTSFFNVLDNVTTDDGFIFLSCHPQGGHWGHPDRIIEEFQKSTLTQDCQIKTYRIQDIKSNKFCLEIEKGVAFKK